MNYVYVLFMVSVNRARIAVGAIRKALGIVIIGNGFDHLHWHYFKRRLAGIK